MVTRSSSEQEIWSVRHTDTFYPAVGAPTVSSSQQSGQAQTFNKFMSWTRTPNYHKLKRDRKILPEWEFDHRWWKKNLLIASGSGSFPSVSPQGINVRSGSVFLANTPAGVTPDFSTIRNELSLKVSAKVKSSSFNAPVFFAEAGRATDMVFSRLQDMRNLVRMVRRGDIGGFLESSRVIHSRVWKTRHPELYPSSTRVKNVERKFNDQFGRDASIAAGNLWLEWKYGWQSIMQDVIGISETLQQVRQGDVNLVQKVETSTTRRWTENTAFTFSVTPNFSGTRETEFSQRARFVGQFRIKNPNLVLPAMVGLTNPLSVAWELIPFSFVADWFLPIGKYLDSLDVPFLYERVSGMSSFRELRYDKYTVKKSPDFFNQNVFGTSSALSVWKERQDDFSWPNPTLTLKNGLRSPERLFTSLSLLGQQIGEFSHPRYRVR